MNTKHFNLLLIGGILLSALLLGLHQHLPSEKLSVFQDLSPRTYLYSTNLEDGAPAATWVNESQRLWRCRSAKRGKDSLFVCSFIMEFDAASKGINLSRFTNVILDIEYGGVTPKIKFFARNFDDKYSKLNDTTTNKFNSIKVDTVDLKTKTPIPLLDMRVEDWWLQDYSIPREYSKPDLRNVTSIGIEFEGHLVEGNHDVKVNSIEFVGERVSAEAWYLGILFCWLGGIFIYALNQLRLLRKQTEEDLQRIRHLAAENKILLQESKEFRRLSTVDPLTEAFNRFGIDEIINSLSQPTRLGQIGYAIVVADIDHFKEINDNYGHTAGDLVLKGISKIIHEQIRSTDFFGRWGGEEFIILLPQTRQEFALALSEKLRIVIQDTEFGDGNSLRVTASFGVSQLEDGEDFSSAFKRADMALYKAKQNGRNRCFVANRNLID